MSGDPIVRSRFGGELDDGSELLTEVHRGLIR